MSSPRRLFCWILICLLVLLLIGGGGYWRYHATRPDYLLRAGQKALLVGDSNTGEELADRLEASGYPDHAHLLRGQAYLRKKQLNLAILEYNQIPHANEAILTEASLIYGLGFMSLGRPVEAEKFLSYVASTRPDNVDARRGLAVIYYDRGAMRHALTHLVKWSELDARDGQPERFMGVICEAIGADNPAVEHYQAALRRQLSPRVRAEAVLELAQLLIKRGEFAEALDYLDQDDYETEDARLAAQELRAECCYSLARHAEAISLLDRVLAENPSAVRGLRLRAAIHVEAGTLEAGLPMLDKALLIDPHDCPSRYQLARAYQLLGRHDEATEQYDRLEQSRRFLEELSNLNKEAIEKPTNVAIRLRLAELCEKLQKPRLAEMWRRAAASCPAEDL